MTDTITIPRILFDKLWDESVAYYAEKMEWIFIEQMKRLNDGLYDGCSD